MAGCRACGVEVAPAFRFCPWCAAPLRRKLVEFFLPPRALPRDRGKALRVSRYLDEGHVRFSVWDASGAAQAAVSVDEQEARRLAAFLRAGERRPTGAERLRRLRGPR